MCIRTKWPIAATAALVALLVTACATLPQARIPTVAFQSVTVSAIEPDIAGGQLSLDAALRFRFTNPLNRSITVPAHEFHLAVDDEVLPFTLANQEPFVLEPESVIDIAYPFTFDLAPDGPLAAYDLLGRDVAYQFVSSVDITLPFSLGTRTVRMTHDGEIRIPLLPTVGLAPTLPTIRLLGTVQTWDVSGVRDVMTPFIDLLFAEDLFGQPIIGRITSMLSVIDTSAGDYWRDFVSAWESFQQGPGTVVVPTGLPDGVRIEVPFDLYNPNYFAIQAPQILADVRISGRQTSLSYLDVGPSATSTVPGRQTRRLRVIAELRWSEIEGGMVALLTQESVNVELSGEVTADVGYGPVRIPVNLPLPLKVGP